MNENMVDTIVNKVLFHLCEINRILMIEGFHYPSEDIEIMRQTHYVEVVESVDEALYVLSSSKKGQQTDVWLPSLSCKELMSTSSGIGGNQISDALLALLLRGYKVYVNPNKIELMQIEGSMSPLYKKHQEALELLVNSGLTTNVIKNATKTLVIDKMICRDKTIVTEKLLVEERVKNYVENGCKEIYVSNKTIITPMAQDYLRQSKVNIVRE